MELGVKTQTTESYRRLQRPREGDEGMLRRVLCGLSRRDYRAAGEAVPEAFGLSRSKRVPPVHPRDRAEARGPPGAEAGSVRFLGLGDRRIQSGDETMVIALGITLSGEKVVLGFAQTGTENATSCAAFLRGGAGVCGWRKGCWWTGARG